MSAASIIAQQWAAQDKARAAAKKKKSSGGGGGLLDDIGGAIGDVANKVGVKGVRDMAWGFFPGLVDLGLGAAHGIAGTAQRLGGATPSKGNDWSLLTNAAKGFTYGLEGTASIGTAPAAAALGAISGRDFSNKDVYGNFNKALAGWGLSGAKKAQAQAHPFNAQPFWNNKEGIAPGLINDYFNTSIAGSVATKAASLGDVGKLANAEVTAGEAARASGTTQAIKAATKAAERAQPVADRLGPEGVAALADRIAARSKVLDVTHALAHPLREPFNRVVRPLTQAAGEARIGSTGAEAEAQAAGRTLVTQAVQHVVRGGDKSLVKEATLAMRAAMKDAAKTGTFDEATHFDPVRAKMATQPLQVPQGAPVPPGGTPVPGAPTGAPAAPQSPLEAAAAEVAAQEEAARVARHQDLLTQHAGEPMVRLYRGEPVSPEVAALTGIDGDLEKAGRWFTPDENLARQHAGPTGVVKTVDVPESVATAAEHPSAGHVLPPDWAEHAATPVEAPAAATPPPGALGQLSHQYLTGADITGTPEADAGYRALHNETRTQLEHYTGPIEQWVPQPDGTVVTPEGLRLTFEAADTYGTDPAAASRAMRTDLIDNDHLSVRHTEAAGDAPNAYMAQPVFAADGVTPIQVPVVQADGSVQEMALTQNDIFRANHDIYGHAQVNDFGTNGELTAWRIHSKMYTPEAQNALANETVGQTAAIEHNPGAFPPQRVVALSPSLLDQVRQTEGAEPGQDMPIPAITDAPPPPPDLTDVPQMRKLAHVYSTELPSWAPRTVDWLRRQPGGEAIVNTLAMMDRVIRTHDTNVLVREMGRMVDATRNQEFHSEQVHILANDVAHQIMGEELPSGDIITKPMADAMIGAEIMARLTGTRLVELWPDLAENDILQEALNRVASQGNRLPKEMIDRLNLEEPLARATDLIRTATEQRMQTLIASRLGTTGLTDESTGFLISPKEAKVINKFRLEIERATRLARQRDGEVQSALEQKPIVENKISALLDEAAQHEDASRSIAGEINTLYETPHPTTNPVVQRNLLEFGRSVVANDGGTMDLMTGETILPDYATSITDETLHQVPLEEFAADPAKAFNDAMAKSPVFNLPWVKLGAWIENGNVHIDPSITEWPTDVTRFNARMRPLTRGSSWLIGAAFRQQSTFALAQEGGSFVTVLTDYDHALANLATHYVDEALNPNSQFSQFLNGMHDLADKAQAGNENVAQLTHAQVDAQVMYHMNAVYADAQATGKLNPDGSLPHKVVEDYFGKRRYEFRKGGAAMVKKGASQALNQVMLRLNLNVPATWDRMVKQLGPNFEKARRWYLDSHDGVERYRGQTITLGDGTAIDAADLMYQLVAITSINTNPLANLGNAMNAMANWSEWQASGSAALDTYRVGMDRFLALPEHQRTMQALVDNILHDVPPAERRGSEIVQQIGNLRASTKEPIGYSTGQYSGAGQHLQALLTVLSGHTLDKWGPEDVLNMNIPFGGAAKTLRKGETVADLMARIPEHIKIQAKEEAAAFGGDETAVAQRTIALHAGTAAWAKILSFWQNLADPVNSRAVTLDAWMARAFGRVSGWSSPGEYAAISAEVQQLADRLGIQPHEVQAVIWTYAKEKITQLTNDRVWGAVNAAVEAHKADPLGFKFGVKGDPIYDMLDANRTQTGGAVDLENTPVSRKFGAKVRRETVTYGADDIKQENARLDEYKAKARGWNKRAKAGDPVVGDVASWGAEHVSKVTKGTEDAQSYLDFMNNPNPRILTGMERTGLQPEVFDGLAQEIEGRVLGHTVMNADNAVVRLFKGGDFHTLLHEDAHVFRQMLRPQDVPVVEDALGVERGTLVRSLEDPLWGPVRRAAEEKFAEEMLGYIFSGQHGNPGLKPVLDVVRASMGDLWAAYSHTREAGYTVEPRLAAIWDKYLTPEAPPEQTLNLITETNKNATDVARGQAPTDWSPEQVTARNRPLPGESISDALTRQKRMGRLLEKAHLHERAAVERMARVAKLQKSLDRFYGIITNGGEAKTLKLIEKSDKRIAGLTAKLEDLRGNPSVRNVPVTWQPVWEAIKTLHKDAADDPVLAQALEEIPDNFTAVLRRAQEMGFDPAHVRDFSPSQVDHLTYDGLGLKNPGDEMKAGTRVRRTTGTPRTQSISALVAATTEVMQEVWTNRLVDYFDHYGAVKIPEGTGIPKGWVPWSSRRNLLIHGTEDLPNTEGVRISAPPRPDMMIPKSVDSALDRMSRNYSHPLLTGLRKVTNPWRTFILTLSPRWYIHTTVGTMLLSVASGAKWEDFAAAWKAYRQEKGGEFNTLEQQATGRGAVGGPTLYHDSTTGGGDAAHSIVKNRGLRTDLSEAVGVRARLGRAKATLTAVHDSINQFARSATYHGALRTTGDAMLALQEASRALIDYGDLTPFERSWVRAVIPFYAWSKGVIKAFGRIGWDHPLAFGLMDRLARINAEVQRDKYGTELPPGYAGVVDVFGHPVNLTFGNPFASGARLLSPDGVAQAMNPFLDVLVRSQFGASEKSRPDQYRMDNYGRLVPDVPISAGLLDVASSLPIVDTVVNATNSNTYDPAYGGGIGGGEVRHFFGDPSVPDTFVQKVAKRTKETQAVLAGKKIKKRKKAKVTSSLDAYFAKIRKGHGL